MRKSLTILAAGALSAVAFGAVAQEVDADGDGMMSMDEMTAAYPEMTEEQFTAADSDGDGMLNEEEYTAAQEAGTIPSEG